MSGTERRPVGPQQDAPSFEWSRAPDAEPGTARAVRQSSRARAYGWLTLKSPGRRTQGDSPAVFAAATHRQIRPLPAVSPKGPTSALVTRMLVPDESDGGATDQLAVEGNQTNSDGPFVMLFP